MPRKRPPRLASFDYLGFHRYFLTITAFRSERCFVSDENVAIALVQLTRAADDERFAVIAYCFMPDHMHAVVEGSHQASDFRQFVRVLQAAIGVSLEAVHRSHFVAPRLLRTRSSRLLGHDHGDQVRSR